jgi:hypothetical protein
MSAIDTRTANRRAAERKAAERRKLIILAGLAVVLVALLAFQLPKLLKRSSSSPTAAATSVTTTAAPAAGAAAPRSLASVSTASSARRLRAIRRLAPRDPFVPLVKESTTSTSSSAAPTSLTGRASATVSQPPIRITPVTVAPGVRPGVAAPTVTKPVHVKPAAPTAAVIWTNGKRQVVGLSQVFTVGDVQFRLAGVTRKAMRVKLVGGLFAGGKSAVTVRKGHPVKLANTATGVEYRLLFTGGTTSSPTVVEPANATDKSS